MENTLIWLQEMEDNNESWVNISSVITMLKKEQEKAITVTHCCAELRDEYLQPELDKYKNIKVERTKGKSDM